MMVVVSLVANVVVLVPVIWGLAAGTQHAAFGPDTPARRILICVYGAILVLSAVLLAWPGGRAALAPGLLVVRVAYKLATVPILGVGHPVAVANLAIAALHALALATLAGR